jgi:hypothetical protein
VEAIGRQILIFVTVGIVSGYLQGAYAYVTIQELIDHGEDYQQQGLSITGYAGSVTILTGPRNLPFYTFTLRDSIDTTEILTVIMQGKPEFADGDRVDVYGVFFKSRKAGRSTITNRIEASIVERLQAGSDPLVA